MKSSRVVWSVLPPLAVCGLLAGWIAMSIMNARAQGFSLFVFAVANLIDRKSVV